MATVIADELGICVDCTMMAANGELGQGDESADQRHAELMAEHIAQTYGVPWFCLALSCEGEWFSSTPCHGCGSSLAGDRFPAVVLSR